MNRNTFNKAVVPGLFSFMVSGYKPKNSEAIWKKLCTVKSSKRAYEENAYFSNLGTVPAKPEGVGISYDEFVQGYTKRWNHKTYGLGIKITEELIEDALYPDIPTKMGDMSKELGSSLRETQELLVHDLINNGTATTYHTAGDGLALFSASHVALRGSTWSNLLSPAADLTASSLQTAIDNFETTKDDSGKYQIIKVQYLIVAPQNAWKAKELLNSAYSPENANNAINTLKERNIQLIVSPYLTDTDAWTLMAEPPSSSSGIIAFERRKATFANDGDFETGDAKFKVTARFSVECNKPDNLYFSSGA
jgi:phage major head subunit gpT-like protein